MFSNLSSSKCSSAPFNSPRSSVRDSDITDIWWWLLQHHPWSIYKSKICTRIFNQPATRPTYMPDPQQPISKKCVWWTLYRIHVTESKKCMLQNCPLDNVQLIFRKKGVIELLWISCLRYTLESSSNMHCSKLHNPSHLHHQHTSYTINSKLDTS